MDPEQTRAEAFVRHLLANPAVAGLTPLQKEEQILLFLQENGRRLAPTLASPSFFPQQPRARTQEILADALRQETDRQLLPFLEELAKREIEFSFASFIQRAPVPADKCREELWGLLQKIASKLETRLALAGTPESSWFRIARRNSRFHGLDGKMLDELYKIASESGW